MKKEQIFTDLQEIIEDKIGVGIEEITLDASFQDDLGCDSLDGVELFMEVESKYNISIIDDDAFVLKTVEKAVDYLFEKLN